MRRLPLEGVRIADLTHVWAGPKCTQILADLGAEVIKIEAPYRTDPARGSTNLLGLERYPNRERGTNPYDRNGYFNTTSRNKYGMSLDLRAARGLDVFKRLVAVSDAVVENFSAGVMDRLGLGYAALRAINPRIVLVSMSGFGAVGPDSRSPAWAETVEAMSGLPMLTGYEGGPPTLTFQAVSDPVGGMLGAAAVLTALHHQRRTGEGQFVDLSQQEAMLSLSPEPIIDVGLNGRLRARGGNSHTRMAPHAIFACREPDSWVAIAVPDDAAWQRFRGMEDGPDGIDAPRFDTLEGRLANRQELEAAIETWTRSLTPDDVTRRLQLVDVPSGPVMNVAELTADPHVQARAVFQQIDHAEVGPYAYYVPAPSRYGSRTLAARRGAPRFGADNHEILRRVIGLSDAEIAELEADCIISSQPLETVLVGT
jgi:crotonobetainyl-CoA:carnitine CoA-transferase CaiB-like acyl-CoA transferase